jgi:hypothetical protein
MTSVLVILFFCLYALFDAIALLPRVGGAYLNQNGLGYTFSVMVHTLKRVFVVSYPPLLGWIALQGDSLYPTIFASYFLGALTVVLVSIFKYPIIRYFIHLIEGYSLGGSVFFAVFKHKYTPHESMKDKALVDFSFALNRSLVYSSSWVYFIYGSALFFINVFGAKFEDQSAVIYQLVGIINALGTLLMSFYLDPKISRNFDQKENIMQSNDSVVAGQLLALAVWGPASMLLCSLIL